MRRSPLLVLTAVLALTVVTGCSDDEEKVTPVPLPATASGPVAEPTESVDMPPDISELDSPKPARGEPSTRAGSLNAVTATGVGPYEIGETQADFTENDLLANVAADASGCTTAVGTAQFGSPKLFFAQGKLVQVKSTAPDAGTDTTVKVGSALADVQGLYPDGKLVPGAAGVQSWQVPEEANVLLFEITADKVSGLTGGVATSVQKTFTTGTGC